MSSEFIVINFRNERNWRVDDKIINYLDVKEHAIFICMSFIIYPDSVNLYNKYGQEKCYMDIVSSVSSLLRSILWR